MSVYIRPDGRRQVDPGDHTRGERRQLNRWTGGRAKHSSDIPPPEHSEWTNDGDQLDLDHEERQRRERRRRAAGRARARRARGDQA
jgi:hypothetical protein